MRSCELSLVVLILLAVSGCGQSTLAPVKGRLTCNGKPVADAAIIFSPLPKNEGDKESGKASSAGTDADGRFVLSNTRKGDGALIGKHRAAITLDETVRSACKSKVVIVEIKPGDNELIIELNP